MFGGDANDRQFVEGTERCPMSLLQIRCLEAKTNKLRRYRGQKHVGINLQQKKGLRNAAGCVLL